MNETHVKLGQRYRDVVSGYVGIATSKTKYLTGCDRVCLESMKSDGDIVSNYFDVTAIVSVDTGIRDEYLELQANKTGYVPG